MMGSKQLDALVLLISQSIDTFKDEYLNAGIPIPLLSSSSSSKSAEMKESTRKKLGEVASIIAAACAQLSAIVVMPELTLINTSAQHATCACLQVAASRNIAGILLDYPEGHHISALSEASKVDTGYLRRILRLLAANHIFQEVSPDVFANNAVSVKLATNKHVKDNVETRTRESFRAASYISDFLNHNNSSTSKPVSPFQLAYGTPLMEYHLIPEGREAVDKFMAGVTGWGMIPMIRDIPTQEFPWSEYLMKSGHMKICDVGSGEGHSLLNLARIYADVNFHVVLQDRPAVLELSKQVWSNMFPEALRKGTITFLPIDFFREPPVRGCDIYYIRHCLHNWHDEECVTILKNIAKAMEANPSSKLLIQEIVLRFGVDTPTKESEYSIIPPWPLPKDFGAARLREYAADISMMGLFDAKERTLSDFIILGQKSGLVYENIWNAEGFGLLQFKLAKLPG